MTVERSRLIERQVGGFASHTMCTENSERIELIVSDHVGNVFTDTGSVSVLTAIFQVGLG